MLQSKVYAGISGTYYFSQLFGLCGLLGIELFFDNVKVNWQYLVELIWHIWNKWFSIQRMKKIEDQVGILQNHQLQSTANMLMKGRRLQLTRSGDSNISYIWWLCIKFISDINKYAIGGYLSYKMAEPKCYFFKFRQASSVCEAELYALEESS